MQTKKTNHVDVATAHSANCRHEGKWQRLSFKRPRILLFTHVTDIIIVILIIIILVII